jgi:hypothetical protein
LEVCRLPSYSKIIENLFISLIIELFHVISDIWNTTYFKSSPGGNDESYPNAKGLLRASASSIQPIVVNVDAHLDVRPLKDGKGTG